MAPYLIDWRKLYVGCAIGVARPRDTAEVAAVLRLAASAGVAIVPQAGNTGLVGGGIPLAAGRSLVLSLERMNRICAVDPANYTITVEAGCILQHVQQAADAVDRLFLSLTAEGCRIGGNLSTNAGGIAGCTMAICAISRWVSKWSCLTASLMAARARKDNTGYDLKHLFIGAEERWGDHRRRVEAFPPTARAGDDLCRGGRSTGDIGAACPPAQRQRRCPHQFRIDSADLAGLGAGICSGQFRSLRRPPRSLSADRALQQP